MTEPDPQIERPEAPVLANTRSDRVKAVRRLSGRSARLRAGAFVVEGPQGVREAVQSPDRRIGAGDLVRELYLTEQAQRRHQDIVRSAASAGIPIRRVTEEVLAAMSTTVTPQGVLAICRPVTVELTDVLAAEPRLVAVLAEVQDPGNAGTVIRAADAAGAEAVVLTSGSVDVLNPKCVRSTAGSLFHLPVVEEISAERAIAAFRSAGLTVFAADGAGDTDLDELLDTAAEGGPGGIAGPVAWVFGNEARGLPREVADRADRVIRIPLHGRAESLNLATAASVCLYATARAQRRGGGCRVRDEPGRRARETPGKPASGI